MSDFSVLFSLVGFCGEEVAWGKRVTVLTLCSTLIKDLKTTTMSARPTLGKMLGVLRYDKHANALKEVVECLLECVDAAVCI